MEILIALIFFGVGLGLIIFFAEQLVNGARSYSQKHHAASW